MGNLTAKTSGEIASFMSPSMTNIKSLKVHFSPKQLGTGDPSPENVMEIEGWDGVNAYNDPKYGGFVVWNQCFDLSTLKIGSGTSDAFNVTKLDTGFRVTANADVSGSGSKVIYFTLKWNKIQNHRYMFLCKIKGDTLNFSNVYIYHADGSSSRPTKNSIGQYAMIETYTGNTAISNSSPRLYIYGCTLLEGESFEVTDLMAVDLDIMFGTTVIDNLFNNTTTSLQRVDWFTSIITNYDYRDYNEGEITTVSAVNNESYTNLSIDWSSEIGIIYDGYVDLISGELVQDMAYGQVTSEWLSSRESGYIGYTSSITALDGASGIWVRNAFNSTARERKSGGIKANCNAFKVLMNSTGVSSSQNRTVFAVDSSITNVSDFISAVETLEQNGNGLYLAYELAEPITHQLTPTQLKSFVGQNNFWSNADYVEIEYDLIETEDIQKCRKKIMLNQPHTESATGDIASFTTNMKAPLKECKVYFNPIQEGSGDPSPDNVRNIVGWDGIEVNSCGKNLWNNEDIIYGYWTDSNGKQSVNQRGCRTQYIYVTSNTTIQLFYYGVQPYSASIIELNDNKEFIKRTHIAWEGVTNPKSLTITTSNETKYIYAQTYTYTSSNSKMTYDLLCSYKMQMEFNTITSYEPYKGNIYSEDWSSEVGTVYGGYVDLAKGELVATHKFVIYNGQEDGWNTYYVSHQIHFTRVISDKKIKMNSSISNLFPNANNIVFGDRKEYSVFGDHNTLPRIYVNAPYEMPNGVTEWKEWLSANPLQVCYELAEPIHYSLTPQQLLTFKGENNIWSDTNGQTEVKFWTH